MADAKAIFEELRQDIDDYGDKWIGYFHNMSFAYAAAYHSQEALLGKVKGAIEAAKKAEEENRLFALGLLTAGIGGLFASHFTKKMKDVAIRNFPDIAAAANGDEIIGQMVGKASNALSQSLKVLQQAGKPITDEVQQLAGIKERAIQPGPFEPTGIKPAEYGPQLLAGATERKNVMSDIARLWSKNAQLFSPEVAQEMADNMSKSQFFTDAPPSMMSPKVKATLELRSKLALWISWALERDRKYWRNQVAVRLYGFSEVHHWGPLRDELILLEVPKNAATHPGEKSLVGRGPALVLGPPTMNMSGFIDWAASPDALHLLFSGLPWNDEGMAWVKERWHKINPPKK